MQYDEFFFLGQNWSLGAAAFQNFIVTPPKIFRSFRYILFIIIIVVIIIIAITFHYHHHWYYYY